MDAVTIALNAAAALAALAAHPLVNTLVGVAGAWLVGRRTARKAA